MSCFFDSRCRYRFQHVTHHGDISVKPVTLSIMGLLYGRCERLFVTELKNEYFTRQIF